MRDGASGLVRRDGELLGQGQDGRRHEKERGCSSLCHVLAWRNSGSLQLTVSSSFLLPSFAQENQQVKQMAPLGEGIRLVLTPVEQQAAAELRDSRRGTMRVNEP